MAIAESSPFTFTVTGDPQLIAAGAVTITSSSADIYCTVDTPGWDLYFIADIQSGTPTEVQIVEGKTAAGSSASYSDNALMIASGVQGPFTASPFLADNNVNYFFVGTNGVDYTNVIGGAFLTLTTGSTPGDPGYTVQGERLVSFFDKAVTANPYGDGV